VRIAPGATGVNGQTCVTSRAGDVNNGQIAVAVATTGVPPHALVESFPRTVKVERIEHPLFSGTV
jgi:hypothetical protein